MPTQARAWHPTKGTITNSQIKNHLNDALQFAEEQGKITKELREALVDSIGTRRLGAPRGLLEAPLKFRNLSNNALNKTISGDQHVLLRKLFKNEGASGLTRESLEVAHELSRRAILNTATSPAQKLVHQERLRQILEALDNI